MQMKRHSQVLKHDFKFGLFALAVPQMPLATLSTSDDLHKQCGGVYFRIQWYWHYLKRISQDSSAKQILCA